MEEMEGLNERYGVCAICLERIQIEEAALVEGCKHAYCVMCILRWAACHQNSTCPQCKHQFESLYVHRSLDGCIHDKMFEESVCLLLGASWFVPPLVETQEDTTEEPDDLWFVPPIVETQEDTTEEPDDLFEYYGDDCEDGDLDESFYFNTSSADIRIGNRRWVDDVYVRAGRKEARYVNRQSFENSEASPSRCPKKNENHIGRRAKRAMRREAADKAAAAAKHEAHLERSGRK